MSSQGISLQQNLFLYHYLFPVIRLPANLVPSLIAKGGGRNNLQSHHPKNQRVRCTEREKKLQKMHAGIRRMSFTHPFREPEVLPSSHPQRYTHKPRSESSDRSTGSGSDQIGGLPLPAA
jgi:hypothetical protein